MKPNTPLTQLTMALVLLASSLVMLADLFLGVLPDPEAARQRSRRQLAEVLAVQVTTVLRGEDTTTLRDTVRALASRMPELRSLAVRRSDGRLVADSGQHETRWQAGADPEHTPHQLSVPLAESGRRWGAVEVMFQPDERPLWRRWLDEPMVRLLAFVSIAGTLFFGLYMRRALQHLDPASVIPDRVQRAFDAMAEGVVVLDGRGRVMLVNRAFRALHPEAEELRSGQPLSAVPWLGAGLAADPAQHPWARAMSARTNTSGDTLEIGADIEQPRQLVVNCAPITDAGGAVRGCLATFDDVSELHRANSALKRAMDEVSAARDEVQRKNAELHRLATRDPLTGCLNRRALYEALGPRFAQAQREGTPIACLMLDIDHFKSVNDNHGHAIGDRVIQEVARKLHDSARGTDIVCRYGGEEFCVIVPGLDEAALMSFAERVRARIEGQCGPAVREVPNLRVTTSVGCEVAGQHLASAQAMIDRADQALYSAKRGGRNRVAQFTG